jgi:hypothetical protein
MKKSVLSIFVLGVILSACREKTEDVSLVAPVGHPTIGLIGTELFSTAAGPGTFTDPGAVGYNNITGDSVPLTAPISNNVDLSAPGFYSVVWSYTINNGYIDYTTTKSRLVLVTSVAPITDYSGTYARTSNGVEVHLTKILTGLYVIDNIGGVDLTINPPQYEFDVYLGQTTDSTLECPPQPNPFGEEVTIELGTFSVTALDTSFSYRVLGAGFGPAIRTFTHQ